jgi:hypothetical protein
MAFSIPAISLYVAAAGTAYGVYSGERGNQMQRSSVNRQRTAQQQAESLALRQQKDAAAAQAAANRKAPDLAEIMAAENEMARLSSSRSTLTAPKAPPRPPTATLGGY